MSKGKQSLPSAGNLLSTPDVLEIMRRPNPGAAQNRRLAEILDELAKSPPIDYYRAKLRRKYCGEIDRFLVFLGGELSRARAKHNAKAAEAICRQMDEFNKTRDWVLDRINSREWGSLIRRAWAAGIGLAKGSNEPTDVTDTANEVFGLNDTAVKEAVARFASTELEKCESAIGEAVDKVVEDNSAWVPVTAILRTEFTTYKKCQAFMRREKPPIQFRRPKSAKTGEEIPNRLVVHAGEWVRYFAASNRRTFDALDKPDKPGKPQRSLSEDEDIGAVDDNLVDLVVDHALGRNLAAKKKNSRLRTSPPTPPLGA